VKLSGEKEFDVITAPAAAPKGDFDFEFHWRIKQDLTGRRIVIRAVGRKLYLQHICFVPYRTVTRTYRAAVDHVTVCKTPGRHHAFPGITRLPNGELGVVFRDGVAHVCPFGRILLTRSRDGGRTWTQPECIWDSPSDERDPSILTLPSGRVLVTLNTWNSWMANKYLHEKYAEQTARIEREGLRKYTGRKIMFSDDSGHTWTPPVNIPPFTPHGPVIGPDGKLYYPERHTSKDRRRVNIYRSDDGGRTWIKHAEVASSGLSRHLSGGVVYDEPCLAILPNGLWLVAIRVQADGYVRLVSSRDGRHWSTPRKLPVRGFPQHLLPLKDGRLLMTYGYRFKPYGVRACISKDDGKTWDMAHEILLRYGAPTSDLGYPVSIELEPGRVFTVYYYNDADRTCYIEGVFYRP